MINKAILVGNLGADPEVRPARQTTVGNLRVATSHKAKKGQEWIEETEWHRVTVFGRTADNVAKYCKKGSKLYIEGRLQTRKYIDREGQERQSTEIVANEVKFL